jgi:hypothetical protein
MREARSASLQPPLQKLGKGKFREGTNGEGNRRGRLPLPLLCNAARISPSPAMLPSSAHVNGVVDFRRGQASPLKNSQIGHSSGGFVSEML